MAILMEESIDDFEARENNFMSTTRTLSQQSFDISPTITNKMSKVDDRSETEEDLLADETATLEGNFESNQVKQKRRRTVSRIVS